MTTLTFPTGHIKILDIKDKRPAVTLHKVIKSLIKRNQDFTLSFDPLAHTLIDEAYADYSLSN